MQRILRPLGCAALGLVLILSACAPSGTTTTHGSSVDRERLYESPEALAEDSDLVAIGEVVDGAEVADLEGADVTFTISRFEITQVLAGEESGRWRAGDLVAVRQFGSEASEMQPPLVPLMGKGGTYLVFLTLSGLPGDLAEQFYVTGSSAGLYTPSEAGLLDSFTQVVPNEFEESLVRVELDKVTF